MVIRRAAGCALVLLALVSLSCSADDERDTVLVMAASSLTAAFSEIEAAFEATYPDIDVRLNLAGSTSLRAQILQGAPADVFASANMATMQAVVDAGVAVSPTVFAGNSLQIAVPQGNPGKVTGIGDLANPALLIGLCDERVPCGKFARQALNQAGVTASIDTNESDVRSLVTKLEVGELDAGIVYLTDVASSTELEAIALPDSVDVPVEYPIATLSQAPNPDAARVFVEFVLSPQGQQILADAGFVPLSSSGV